VWKNGASHRLVSIGFSAGKTFAHRYSQFWIFYIRQIIFLEKRSIHAVNESLIFLLLKIFEYLVCFNLLFTRTETKEKGNEMKEIKMVGYEG
jgi:hypothetical protein